LVSVIVTLKNSAISYTHLQAAIVLN